MKEILKLLPLVLFVIASTSCRTQKPVDNKSQVLYQEASKALDEHRFILEAYEFYLPSDKSPVKYSSGSYISMYGSKALIKYSPDLAPPNPAGYLDIKDDKAKITREKDSKKGDMHFTLSLKGDEHWKNRKILITLYKNTNECFVQIYNDYGSLLASFKGYVLMNEEG